MRKIGITFLGLVLALIPSLAGAQPSSNYPLTTPRASQGRSGTSGVLSNVLARTLLLGVTVSYWASREDLRARDIFRSDGLWGVDLIDVGETYGDGLILTGISGATWGTGRLTRYPILQKTGQKMLLGLALDGVLVNGIKIATARRRPDGSDSRSFPSGHTSSAFTVSTILARRHGWKVGIPAFGLASLTAIGRMEDHRHFASDVVAGAFLGYVVGRLITPPENKSSKHGPVEIYSGLGEARVKISF
jgi:membrane-associated phospholipid phosphatase